MSHFPYSGVDSYHKGCQTVAITPLSNVAPIPIATGFSLRSFPGRLN